MIGLIILLSLTGCASKDYETKSTKKIITTKESSKVVKLNKVDMSHMQSDNVIKIESQPSFNHSGQTMEDIYNYSDLIVEGQVKDTYFTSIDGIAYTVMEFKVKDVLKGNAEKNSVITTLTLGGYITLREHIEAEDDAFRFSDIPEERWNTTYLENATLNAGYPKVGEKYVLALTDDSAFVKDAYSTLNIYEGMFKYTNDKYVRTLPEGNYYGRKKNKGMTYFENNTTFEYKWFKEKCNKYKKQISNKDE